VVESGREVQSPTLGLKKKKIREVDLLELIYYFKASPWHYGPWNTKKTYHLPQLSAGAGEKCSSVTKLMVVLLSQPGMEANYWLGL
jgi:hypothetical protein